MRKVLAALLTGAMLLLPTAALAAKPVPIHLTVVSQEEGESVVGVELVGKLKNIYSTWVAVVCRDGGEVVSIQNAGVVWNADEVTGTAGPFSLDTNFCYAYAWIFPRSGENQRVSERLNLSPWIAIDSDSELVYGGFARFHVVWPFDLANDESLRIINQCYQDGTQVWQQGGSPAADFILGNGAGPWQGGAAECRADLYKQRHSGGVLVEQELLDYVTYSVAA